MSKNNGRNGVPAWAAAQLEILKRVSLRLAADARVDRRESRRLFAQNEAHIAQNEKLLVEWREEHLAQMSQWREEHRSDTLRLDALISRLTKISEDHGADISKLTRLSEGHRSGISKMQKTLLLQGRAILKLLGK